MEVANTLAYCNKSTITAVKCFIVQNSGPNVMKLSASIIYDVRNKLVFVPGKYLRHIHIFMGQIFSLLRTFINYGRKGILTLGPGIDALQ